MAKKGLIKKSRDKTRKNVIRVSITEKGREMCSNVMNADFIRSIMSSLSETQRQQLQSCLTILNEAAQKELREEAQNQSPETQ
jgi:DNA-binding MarR family transcriptional regulator